MAHELRLGILTLPNVWTEMVERGQRAEAMGFDSFWTADHYVNPYGPPTPWFEGWTSLAALAALTSRIRVGVPVTCITFRNPVLFAKEALTVDHISGGRLELGLGAGYDELEHRMMGISFPPPPERVARFREVVEIVDGLLRHRELTYHGRYYHAEGATLRPPPVQQPRPPLVLAGKGPRMLKVIAAHADTWNSSSTLDDMRARNRFLDEQCAALGRDAGEIRRSLLVSRLADERAPAVWESRELFLEIVGRYREAGVTEFVCYWPSTPAGDRGLERIAAEIVPTLRGNGTSPAPAR
ncbi:MAG: LLM class flavin-dependent oxidoreductase [Chloroflexota bacterium]|nr:LLM class flavin-dependent oxidoreductase [Chloroflexota bacterium]